uniref:RPN13_C domain-containing protein n=1 Tax=Syphacia muris TaxID=451379 RepID=A0A0N5AL75_9BILA
MANADCFFNSFLYSRDLIIFPGDTEFIRIKECTDGRVYMLKFKSTDERRLFWMQDGDTDKDDEYCKKVNEVLNNPPAPRQSSRSAGERSVNSALGGALAAFNSGSENDLSALGNLDQTQLMQLLSLMNNPTSGSATEGANFVPQLPLVNDEAQQVAEGSVSTRVATPSNTPANGTVSGGSGQTNAVQLSQLKDIIASIGNATRAKNPRVELSDVLNNNNVGEAVKNNSERLIPHLPNQEPIYTPQQELEQTVRTPQFRQAVDIFGHAFQTGQLAPVLSQFGMPPEVASAAQSGDLVSFAQKLTEAESHTKSAEASKKSTQSTSSCHSTNPEIDAKIEREAAEEENNESSIVKEPEPKRGKPDDDNMELD